MSKRIIVAVLAALCILVAVPVVIMLWPRAVQPDVKTEKSLKAAATWKEWQEKVEPLPERLKERGRKYAEANMQFNRQPWGEGEIDAEERLLVALRADMTAAEALLPKLEKEARSCMEGEMLTDFLQLLEEAKEHIPVVKSQIDRNLEGWATYRKAAGIKARR